MPGVDKKISELTAKGALDALDNFVIDDSVSGENRKVAESILKSQVLGELENLTTAEIQQLENIDTTTISTTQWGYVGSFDQGVATTDNVQFGTINGTALTASGTITFSGLSVLDGIVTTNGTGVLASSTALPNGTTATTQSADDKSTKVATTAYVDNAYFTVDTSNVSNPPTDAELDSMYGSPALAGTGFTIYIDDAGTGTNFYTIVSDGSNWWIFTGTKAV